MKKYLAVNVTLDDEIFFPAHVAVGEDWNGFALPYFSLEQGKRLCDYLNHAIKDNCVVVNLTDNIIASPAMSRAAAENFVQELLLRFKKQGYYLTATGERINYEDVKLELQYEIESRYDDLTDSFVIQEQLDGEFEPVTYTGEDIVVEGEVIHAYPIGAGSWIWSIVTRLN